MLAEELLLLDGESRYWQPVRPLLDAALRLDSDSETLVWQHLQNLARA